MIFFLFITQVWSTKVTILGDLDITGSFECSGLTTEAMYSEGTVHTSDTLTVNDITSDEIMVSEITLESINPIDSEIVIDADVLVNAPETETAFIQLHWQAFLHENFEFDAQGWNSQTFDTCNGRDHFLRAYAGEKLESTYTLPRNSGVRITASIHLLDNWQGEEISLKVDNELVWVDTGKSGAFNICGETYNDAAYALPLDIVLKNKSGEISLSFSSTLQHKHASFGIDNLIIYLK